MARRLAVDQATGLSTAEAAGRLQSGGANRLARPAPRSAWCLFLSQFKSVLTLVLIGAAGLAALIGNVRDAAVILAVAVINAIVGFYQEYRAERSLAALGEMLPQKSHVRRDGQKLELHPEALCVAMWCCWKPATVCPQMAVWFWQSTWTSTSPR